MAKKIYVIRHAESESNAGVKTDHPATISLTPAGHAQAKAKADAFTATPDVIATSPFLRTKQTAAPFIEKFPDAAQEEWEMQEFTFLGDDKYKNTTHIERYPFLKAYWEKADPDYRDAPESETFREFIERMRRVVEKMKQAGGDVTVAFSHGYTMTGILFVLEGRDKKIDGDTMKDYWNFYLKLMPRNVETFEFDADKDGVAYIPRPRPQAPVKKPAGPKIND